VSKKILRFAPSPTGHLHIGGVRTALINYLYTKTQEGELILRIEDTDQSRSSREMSNEIVRGLEWVGIHWDKGPYYQSLKFDNYKKIAFQLMGEQKAYKCFCRPEEIKARRESADKKDQIYKYDRKCLGLTNEEIKAKLEKKIPFVIRFKIPAGETRFKDKIHKEMRIENSLLEDFVILKSDFSPTYHLSVVVDDKDMGITHVIRGDDHISNTYKQILLFIALRTRPPQFAHLPLILGEDKKKLSKRHGETSIIEFKQKGYLPEAIITYLCQLSWIPGDNKKIFLMDELVKDFSLGKLSKSNPVFDYKKLRFINNKALQQKSSNDLYYLLIENDSFKKKHSHITEKKKIALIHLVKPRMKTLEEFKPKFNIYFKGNVDYDKSDLEKLDISQNMKMNMERLSQHLEQIKTFDSNNVEQCLRDCAIQYGIKAADLIHPSRFALTFEAVGPSIFEIFEFLGQEEVIKRIRHFITFIENYKKK